MKELNIIIKECDILIDSYKYKIQNELYEFTMNNWLNGIIIHIEKIDISKNPLNTDICYTAIYTENVDENYIEEIERLNLGL